MVNGILGQQVESQISEQILKELIKYHMSIKGTMFDVDTKQVYLQSKKTKRTK